MNSTQQKLICLKCEHYAQLRCNALVFKKCGDKFPWAKLTSCPKDKWTEPKI